MDRLTLMEAGHEDQLGEAGSYLKLQVPKVTPLPQPEHLPGAASSPDAQERLAHIVRTIEADIIPRLLRAHPHEASPAVVRKLISQPSVDAVRLLASLVLAVDDAAWAEAVEEHLASGLCAETLCVELLAPAARELGRLWDEDLIGFADVTVGLGRLQRTLRALAPEFENNAGGSFDGRRILLLMMPGDDHTFGISMVAEFFRRAGWDVVGHTDPRCANPRALVASEWFDVVGVSAGDGTRLELLPALIADLREASRNSTLAVLLGGPVSLLEDQLAQRMGADGVASDARLAPALAEKMLETRTGRLYAASS